MLLDTNSPAAICAALASDSSHNRHGAAGSPIMQERAKSRAQPGQGSPVPAWSSGHMALAPYEAAPHVTFIVNEIMKLHRLRLGIIRAQTKLVLQGQAVLRLQTQSDADFVSDEAKKKARKRTEDLYRAVRADKSHPLYADIEHFVDACSTFDAPRNAFEKSMIKLAKQLPVYSWVKNVKGFGDISFATLVGECGDIGTYKSVSAVWKRLGLAVSNETGRRQGNPGPGATADDWIKEGYNKQRRSVSYVAREHVIGGMGKWRPDMGEDVWANPNLTYYQQVYADRARYEAARSCYHKKKDGSPKFDENGEIIRIACSDKGRESYSAHAAMRAHRYVEKRLLKHLYLEWRRA
jgi:hypothetical protein